MPLTDIHEFLDDEKPNAEQMNSVRTALIQAFLGNITSADLSWPLIAQGTLDMNNNPIINVASLGGEIHVNESKSLIEAVADANAAGGGTIVIDPGFEATSASGVNLSADGITIRGGGDTSKITASDGVVTAIKISGSDCHIENLRVDMPSFPSTLVSAIAVEGAATVANTSVENVHFNGGNITALRLGGSSDATICRVSGCLFESVGVGVVIQNADDVTIEGNSFRTCVDAHIQLGSTSSVQCKKVTIAGNVLNASVGIADQCIKSGINSLTAHHEDIAISGNIMDSGTVSPLELDYFPDCVLTGNSIRGATALDNCSDMQLTGNNFIGATSSVSVSASSNISFASNRFHGIVVISGGSVNSDIKFNGNEFALDFTIGTDIGVPQFVNNHLRADLTGYGAKSDTDFVVYGLNLIDGSIS
jgi:hypothetical protein